MYLIIIIFLDINARISNNRSEFCIVDLTNAMKKGKTCKQYLVRYRNETFEGVRHIGEDLFNGYNLKTFKDVYNRVVNFGLNDDLFVTRVKELDAKRVFSPFVRVKPIKRPAKWTIPHVWKAILAGQIFKGVKRGYYTDDYAYDMMHNFRMGEEVYLPSLAQDLIENPNGWYVIKDGEENGVVRLRVNCHTFDLNTLYFDEKRSWGRV